MIMKIDTSKIEGYEDLTAEEKVQVLEAFELEEDTKELEKAKKNIARANGEAADWKRKYKALEEEKQGEKNASEIALERLQAEVQQLQKEKKESEHKANFLSLGYEEGLANEAARALIEGDLSKFFECQKKHQVDYKKNIEKEAIINMSTPSGGGKENNYAKLTEEEFRQLEYMDRVRLKKEQPDLFNKFTI